MNRLFAVLFSRCGFRWAKSWLAGIDEKVLVQTVNSLRMPNGKANPAVVLEDLFYKTSEFYATADTIAKERAAIHAARNVKALQDAEIGLVRCQENCGLTYLQFDEESKNIADRHGLFGVKKRNSKSHPPNGENGHDERKTNLAEDNRTFDDVRDGVLPRAE